MMAMQDNLPALDAAQDELLEAVRPPVLGSEEVERLVSDIESALLVRSAHAMYAALDKLLHKIELQAEYLAEMHLPAKALSWRISLIRVVASRTTHAMIRIPEFGSLVRNQDTQESDLPGRLFGTLDRIVNSFADPEFASPFMPETWIKMPAAQTDIRLRLGVAHYHAIRIWEMGGAVEERVFSQLMDNLDQNFDILFYALTHGPLEGDGPAKEILAMLASHLAIAEGYLDQPQTAISRDPELFMLPRGQVLHVLTMVDRVRDVLDMSQG